MQTSRQNVRHAHDENLTGARHQQFHVEGKREGREGAHWKEEAELPIAHQAPPLAKYI